MPTRKTQRRAGVRLRPRSGAEPHPSLLGHPRRGDFHKPAQIAPVFDFCGTCPTRRTVKGEGETKVLTLLFLKG
jgi:hypothetical protein